MLPKLPCNMKTSAFFLPILECILVLARIYIGWKRNFSFRAIQSTLSKVKKGGSSIFNTLIEPEVSQGLFIRWQVEEHLENLMQEEEEDGKIQEKKLWKALPHALLLPLLFMLCRSYIRTKGSFFRIRKRKPNAQWKEITIVVFNTVL